MTEFEKQLHNYRLTTAEILYHIPDYPELLQTFIWQVLDIHPEFPVLRRCQSMIEAYARKPAKDDTVHPVSRNKKQSIL